MWKKNDTNNFIEKLEEDLQNIRKCVQKGMIPNGFTLQSSEIPDDIKKCIKQL